MEIDDTDREIIACLDRGKVKVHEIAAKLSMKQSTVHARIMRLRKEKILKGIKGSIDWKRAGWGITAYVLINIDTHLLRSIKKTQDQLRQELLASDNVKEAQVITGDADLMAKVIARDTEEFKGILLNHIDGINGIVKTKTMIVLE
jgi:Lrp/AsnC family transcriptional regulator for asnA, asnC and gidA